MAELGLVPLPERDPSRLQLISHFHQLINDAVHPERPVSRFPGTMPTTLSRRHLDMMAVNDFVCLEKSDGTRYMLLAITSHVVLIDRRMHIYVVDPNPLIMSQGFEKNQDNTILDGELTFNQATRQWEYLIYDAVAIDNDLSIAKLGFRERMQAAEAYVAGPRLWAPFCAGLLRLRIKDFYERNHIRRLFDHIKKDPSGNYIYYNNNRRDGVICNENDGVIFAPVQLQYQLKNSDTLLKWKPPHLNSVDFQLKLSRANDARRNEPSVRVTLAYKGDGHGVQDLRDVHIPFKIRRQWTANFDYFNNSIAEFAYDRAAGEWRYIRQREDKETPNFSTTIISTMESIAESIDREELVRKMEKTGSAPDQQRRFVEINERNVKVCSFPDDYFDENNLDFLTTTPISLTPPPNFPPPPHGGDMHRRGRHHGNREGHRVANGDASRRRDDAPSDPSQPGRVPFVYNEDV